jgi:general secretion pathway protein G
MFEADDKPGGMSDASGGGRLEINSVVGAAGDGRKPGSSLSPITYSLFPSEEGVTLIELLVVVTIIALFAALVGPRLFKNVGKSRVTAAHAQISAFQTALGVYKLDTGTFPTTEQGLQALRTRPEGMERWDGPYLPQDIPMDPWGHPYIYRFPGEHGDEPDIISYGNDGRAGGEGEDADILSWTSRSGQETSPRTSGQ